MCKLCVSVAVEEVAVGSSKIGMRITVVLVMSLGTVGADEAERGADGAHVAAAVRLPIDVTMRAATNDISRGLRFELASIEDEVSSLPDAAAVRKVLKKAVNAAVEEVDGVSLGSQVPPRFLAADATRTIQEDIPLSVAEARPIEPSRPVAHGPDGRPVRTVEVAHIVLEAVAHVEHKSCREPRSELLGVDVRGLGAAAVAHRARADNFVAYFDKQVREGTDGRVSRLYVDVADPASQNRSVSCDGLFAAAQRAVDAFARHDDAAQQAMTNALLSLPRSHCLWLIVRIFVERDDHHTHTLMEDIRAPGLCFATQLVGDLDRVRGRWSATQSEYGDLVKAMKELAAVEEAYGRGLRRVASLLVPRSGEEFVGVADALAAARSNLVHSAEMHQGLGHSIATDVVAPLGSVRAEASTSGRELLGRWTASHKKLKAADDKYRKATHDDEPHWSVRFVSNKPQEKDEDAARVSYVDLGLEAKASMFETQRVLTEFQQLEETAVVEMRDALRKLCVYLSSALSSRHYDLQSLARVLEDVQPETEIKRFLNAARPEPPDESNDALLVLAPIVASAYSFGQSAPPQPEPVRVVPLPVLPPQGDACSRLAVATSVFPLVDQAALKAANELPPEPDAGSRHAAPAEESAQPAEPVAEDPAADTTADDKEPSSSPPNANETTGAPPVGAVASEKVGVADC